MKKLIIATFLSAVLIFSSVVFSDDDIMPPVPNSGGGMYVPIPLPEPMIYNPQGQSIGSANWSTYTITQRRMIKFRTSKADQVFLYQPEQKAELPAVGADTTRKLSIPKN